MSQPVEPAKALEAEIVQVKQPQAWVLTRMVRMWIWKRLNLDTAVDVMGMSIGDLNAAVLQISRVCNLFNENFGRLKDFQELANHNWKNIDDKLNNLNARIRAIELLIDQGRKGDSYVA